jgi:hypothetical protein
MPMLSCACWDVMLIKRRRAGFRVYLSAAAPRTREGKPDFSGIWIAPGYSTRYLDNLAADGVDVRMKPWAAALYKERQENLAKDRPGGRCLPHSVTDYDAHHMPDFGHMEVQVTIDDSKTYDRPWTVKLPWELVPDADLLDWVCENEKDFTHLLGK